MLRTIRHMCLAIWVVTCAPAFVPAFADVKAFNAAVAKGDYKTAAAEAETIWQSWNFSDSDTAVVGREFGFAAMASGKYAFARDIGKFLVEKGATLATPDTAPQASAVLYRAAAFRLSPGDEERSALRDALVARSAAPGLDMTSVLGWETLYNADFAAGDLEVAGKDAGAAAVLMARDPRLLMRQRAAEVRSVSAYFVSARNTITRGKNQYYLDMADIHDKLAADIDATDSVATRQSLWTLKWLSEAWALAIYAHLTSAYSQTGSIINMEQDFRRLVQPKTLLVPEDPATMAIPICEGELVGTALHYPDSKASRGMVGSVIARVETGADGKVTHVEVLASVPYNEFSGLVVDRIKTWRYRPKNSNSKGSCRLNFRNYYYRAQFRIQ